MENVLVQESRQKEAEVGNLWMKSYNNHLQEKMKEDKLKIRNSNKVVISADKTGNFYMVIFQC